MKFFCIVIVICQFFWALSTIYAQAPKDGLTFYCSFDKGFDADMAIGNRKGMLRGDVPLFEQGLRGKAALVNGGKVSELRYETAGNLNGPEGTISLFARSHGFRMDDEFFRVFIDSYDSPMKSSDALILYKRFNAYNSVSFYVRPKGEESRAVEVRKDNFVWNPGEWHHLVATWGNNTLSFYVNGTKAGERNYSGELEGFGKYFFVGASSNRWPLYRPPSPDTVIDELRIYNRRLSDDEIMAIYSEFDLETINQTLTTQENASAEDVYSPPFAEINYTPNPPVIDGIINSDEWRHATAFSGMISLGQGTLSSKQAKFYLTYDKENLYIAMESPIAEGTNLLHPNALDKRDFGGITDYDGLEVHLDPLRENTISKLLHFIGNFHGDIFDRKGLDIEWDADWKFKNKVTETLWTAEISVPFASLGVKTPEAGEAWGINLCRNQTSGTQKWTSLVQCRREGAYRDVGRFAEIRFVRQGIAVQSPLLTGLDSMRGKYDWNIFNLASDGKALRIFSRIYSEDGRLLQEQEREQFLISGGEQATIPVSIDAGSFLKRGSVYYYEFSIQDGRVGSIVFSQRIPLRFMPEDKKLAETLSPAEKKKLQDEFAAPWRGNTIGIDHHVPHPWTPVEITDRQIGVWGRKYLLDDGLLPNKIEAVGEQILAGPVKMIVAAGGKETDIGRMAWEKTEQHQDVVTLEGVGRYDGWTAEGKTRIEFDGMLRFDITIAPGVRPLEIDNLYVEIPVHKKNVIYAHYFRDRWNTAFSGYMPTEGLSLDFKRQVWVGDEQRGLAWFAPSMKNWDNTGRNITSIKPEGDKVVIRIDMINHAVKRTEPFTITFGLHATPVKPRPTDWRKWQQFRRETGNVPQSRKYEISGLMWRYGEGFSSPVPGDPEYFKKEVKRIHSENTLAVPYASPTFMSKLLNDLPAMEKINYARTISMAAFTKEYKLFADEWRVVPGRDWENAVSACPKSEWTDFLVWAINDMVDKYDIDGIYFDCVWVDPCMNEKHGCGYLDAKGSYRPTFNIFEQREMKKRIYKVIKNQSKDTIIVDHLTAILDAPLISFCDIGFGGEQVHAGPNDNYFNFFSLDKMRSEFTGIQWGFIPMIMSMFKTDVAEIHKSPEAAERFFNLVLLHDMLYFPLWINWNVYRRFARTYIDFGIFDARFYPYWESPLAATADADDIRISAYVLPDKALLIVSNIGSEEKTVRVSVDAKTIGIGKFKKDARDLFHDQSFSVDNGKILTLPLKPYNFRAIQLLAE